MKILSHRGYWKSPEEKNTRLAFERSFKLGFGTETDLRDHNGNIFISHDMPVGDEMKFQDFLDIASHFSTPKNPLTLALNIKADGLQDEVFRIINQYKYLKYFVFDMSIPDMRHYIANNVPIYTRISDIEQHPVYFDASEGVWLDNFSEEIWFNEEYLEKLLSEKEVCVVSAELHSKNPLPLWNMLENFSHYDNLSLCTDQPEEAVNFLSANKKS